MRWLVGLTFAILAILAIASASSCFVDNKTSDFDCSVSTDCPMGRTCDNGFCITVDAPIIPPCVESACVANGGACNLAGTTCVFTCSIASCPAIQCPPDIPCQIDCNAADACSTTSIACGDASPCTINCSGTSSCGQRVRCGSGQCSVSCSGDDSCAAGTDCDAACACTVTCGGTNACAIPADCHGGSPQCPDGNGCDLGGNCQNNC